jgi:O-antigen/teichoic acid export membrane protein
MTNIDDAKERSIIGFFYSITFAILRKGTGLIGIAVLSRFLEAKDFSIFAIVSFILGFLKLFGDSGLTV